MMRLLVAAACVGLSTAQVVETMQDYAEIGKRFAEYAATATPTDDEVWRNVLAAGSQGSAAGGSSGCPGGCSSAFIEEDAPSAEVRSDDKNILKRIKVNVAKQQAIPQELLALVENYEKKRNEQEQSLLETALHSKSAFIGRESFDVRIGGSKRFPSFYRAVRDMESLRKASESHIRAELISMLTNGHSSFLKKGSAKELAEAIAQIQKKVAENPAYGESVIAALNRKNKSNFMSRPELNVQYEFPISDYAENTPKSQISFAEIENRINEESGMVANLAKSVKHSQFLRDGSQFERKTQAPIVWLHLNGGHSSFVQVPQAITPAIDLFLEQAPSAQ